MTNYIKLVLALVLTLLVTGCSANFVAAKRDFNLQPGKKPVIGVIYAGFTVNDTQRPQFDAIMARRNVDYINSVGGHAVLIDSAVYPQIAAAAQNYGKIVTSTGLSRPKITPGSCFGDLHQDFRTAGVNAIMLVSGRAQVPNLANFATDIGLIYLASTLSALYLPQTPSADFSTVVTGPDGKPLYYDECGFYRIFRRDIASDSDRTKMFAKNYQLMLDNLPEFSARKR